MTDQTDRAVLARIGQMADYWEQHLPEVIRTPAVVSALRAALERAPAGQAPATDQTAERCSSCEHEAKYHDVDGRCWFTVEQGVPGRDAVCSCQLRRLADEAQPAPDLAAADHPTPLRWGLDDVLYGDDDTTTVLLSGPGGEPYWLELDPERAVALREALAGPDGETQQDGARP